MYITFLAKHCNLYNDDVCNLFFFFQVCNVLDALGLHQYKAIFMEEEITGEVLVNLTNEVLEYDLNITSAQDRLKLMKVIEGRCPFPVYLIPIMH